MQQARTIRDLSVLLFLTFALQLIIWLPYIISTPNLFNLNFSNGFSTIYKNYDGLNYIVIAKSLYAPSTIGAIPNTLNSNYYAAHFPAYALAILSLAPILGFLKSMLFITSLFTFLSAAAFYFLIKQFGFSNQPLYLSALFLVLPGRWLVVHTIGSPEPMFILFTILSIYAFLNYQKFSHPQWIWLSGIFGLFAQVTRPPGILLFLAFCLYLTWQFMSQKKYLSFKKTIRFIWSYLPLLLIPLSLVGVFQIYAYSYHDFWAYFHSGDNIHLQFVPFGVFNKSQYWVGDIWLEDILYILLLGFLSGLYMLKNKSSQIIGFYILVYTLATTLVAHRDISRYILPITPFAIIAFEKLLTSREFKIVLGILGLGIYLYAQNFLLNNTAPIPNLQYYN